MAPYAAVTQNNGFELPNMRFDLSDRVQWNFTPKPRETRALAFIQPSRYPLKRAKVNDRIHDSALY
jgi:hypothetical protein